MKKLSEKQKGFTLIELMVSIAIFAFMTAFMLAKYGGFNQSILLTNLAYDVALTIRTAQSYGLNVKSSVRDDNKFDFPYGVHFQKNATSFIFFVDENSNGIYDINEKVISTSNMKRGATISNIEAYNGPCFSGSGMDIMDITFKRPDPDAIIMISNITYPSARITLKGSDGSTRRVSVYSTGQIAVMPN